MKNPLGKYFAKNPTKENSMNDNVQIDGNNQGEAQIKDEFADLELEIKYIPIEQINPYENNSRTHSEEQIIQIADDIRDNGMIDPILIQNNTIIYGHARVEAMKLLGREKICSIEVSHLTRKQIIRVVISNNKLALNAGWDNSILQIEAEEYIELGGQMSELGFDGEESNIVLGGWDSDIPDAIPKEAEYFEKYNILIECTDELDQFNNYEKLKELGYKCQIQSL